MLMLPGAIALAGVLAMAPPRDVLGVLVVLEGEGDREVWEIPAAFTTRL